jgi:peptide/nickel transport system permease protein
LINYIIRRLLQALIVVVLVTLLVFLAMHLLPGDPITLYVTENQLAVFGQEQIDFLKHQYGLDKPMIVQYFNWMKGLFQGNLGRSVLFQVDSKDLILQRIPITLQIGIAAFILDILIGVPAGIISAARRSKFIDTLITFFANIGITIPNFWLGFILVYIFSLQLKILPVQGYTSPFTDIGMNIKQLILPVFCLSVTGIAGIVRQTRSSMLEVINQDYIRTAWSKGLTERAILFKHALKNGMIPVMTLLGMRVRTIIGGTVLIETVFNLPGIGRLATDSLFAQDYQVVQSITVLIAVTAVVSNLVVDLLYGVFDPRIRYA